MTKERIKEIAKICQSSLSHNLNIQQHSKVESCIENVLLSLSEFQNKKIEGDSILIKKLKEKDGDNCGSVGLHWAMNTVKELEQTGIILYNE